MPLSKLASSHAHLLLSKLIDLGIAPPMGDGVTQTAKCEEYGLQVVVTIASYAPLRIDPTVLDRIQAMANPSPASPPLTPLQQQIVNLLDPVLPRKASWLAVKLGRMPGGSFRSTLATLARFGVIKRIPGRGYVRT